MPGASIGTFSYNGVTLDGTTEAKVRVEFIRDDAQRTVIAHKVTITASGFVTAAGAATDTTMEDVRNKLSKQGGQLIFINRGFGTDLRVNMAGGGGLRDIAWGPVPELLELEPTGADRAWRFVWQVSTQIPPCGLQGATSGLKALNYSVDYSIRDGYSTRTIRGYLEIAQTRNGRNVPDCADLYRHLINPALPDHDFKRESTWTTSPDKSRLDFTLVDQQIASRNAWPLGVVRISGVHDVEWSRHGMTRLQNTIRIDLEMARGYGADAAYAVASLIFRQRIAQAVQYSGQGSVLLTGMRVSENIFGTEFSFAISYRIMGKGPADFLNNLRSATGIWTPVGTDWQQWAFSMQATHSNRGYTGGTVLPQSDTIIDLCGAGQSINWGGSSPIPQNQQFPPYVNFQNQAPPPNKSWLRYQNMWAARRKTRVVQQSFSQQPNPEQASWGIHDTYGADFQNSSGTRDIVQVGGNSSYRVAMIGSAWRVGYEIPRPRMTQLNGVSVTEQEADFIQIAGPEFLGIKTYRAYWMIVYVLPNSPGNLPPPINAEFD